MKKLFALLLALTLTFALAACGQSGASAGVLESTKDTSADIDTAKEDNSDSMIPGEADSAASAEDNAITNETEVSEVKIKITAGETELIATMEDNATTRAIMEQMPMTLSMMDLYGREMCYRYGAYALPTDDLRTDGYEVGDIAYWAPGGSLIILYAQNGEHFERQHLGHIDSGVEVFENTGDVDVTFEVVSD